MGPSYKQGTWGPFRHAAVGGHGIKQGGQHSGVAILPQWSGSK